MVIDEAGYIAHIAVYDPAKAHDYYIRTRDLKGRTPKTVSEVANRKTGATVSVIRPAKTKSTTKAFTVSPAAQIAAFRTKKLRGRLSALNILLKELLRQAHAENVKNTTKGSAKDAAPSKDSKGSADGKAKPLTAQQKHDKAVKAKEVYKKDHPQSRKEQIAAVRKQIAETESQLKAAVSKARAIAQQTAP